MSGVWLKWSNFSSAPSSLSFRHEQILLPVRGFWELILFLNLFYSILSISFLFSFLIPINTWTYIYGGAHSIMKIGKKISTHPSANISTYALCARSVSLNRKNNMAALSELLLQLVTHLHADSHVKPRRVKMCMQMWAGRKGHKKNEHASAKVVILCFTVVCFGQELIRGETEFSLKRQGEEQLNTERKFLVIERFYLAQLSS